jgi:hypothetical protein
MTGSGYGCSLPAMVNAWRSVWRAEETALFGIATLAAGGSEGAGQHMAGMRWSQTANYGYWPNPALPNTFGAQVGQNRTEQNRTEQNTKGKIIVSQVLVGTRADVPRRTPDCRNRKVCAAHRLTDRGCGTVLYVLYRNTDGANSFMIWATRGLVSAMATHARLTPRPASQPPPRRSNAVRKEKHNERL